MRNVKQGARFDKSTKAGKEGRGGRPTRNAKEAQARSKEVPPRDQLDAMRRSAGKGKNKQARRPKR